MAPSPIGTGALQRGHRRGVPQLPQSGRAQHGRAAPSVGLPPQIAHDDCAGNGAAAGGGAAGAAHWRVVCSTSTASAQRTARLAILAALWRVVSSTYRSHHKLCAFVLELSPLACNILAC